MNTPTDFDEWLSQARQALQRIEDTRLDMNKLFPNNEHCKLNMQASPSLRENFQKFFNKPLSSLVPIETLTSLSKLAPDIGVPDNQPDLLKIKQARKATIMLQLNARTMIGPKDSQYVSIKFSLGEIFKNGVSFNEAKKLKRLLDENREIEMGLCFKYLSIKELTEYQKQLQQQSKNTGNSFQELIEQKLEKFRLLDRQITVLLNRHSLSTDNLKQICWVLGEAEQVKYKMENFKFIRGIRDSFRWVHMLKQFWEGKVFTKERFEQISANPSKVDISTPISLQLLTQRLGDLIKKIESTNDVPLFKALLLPIKEVEVTDESINRIMEYLKTSEWSFEANSKLSKGTMTSEDLVCMIERVPSVKKETGDPVYKRLEDLGGQLIEFNSKSGGLLEEMRLFISENDTSSLLFEPKQQLLISFSEKAIQLEAMKSGSLSCISDLDEDKTIEICTGLVSLLNISSSINSQKSISKEVLKSMKGLLNTSELSRHKENSIVKHAMKYYQTHIKIIRFFDRLRDSTLPPKMALRDDIYVVKEYYRCIAFEEKSLDYSKEIPILKEKIEEFENWEAKVSELIQKYQIHEVESNYQEFVGENASQFDADFAKLKILLKQLSFKSIKVERLLVLGWSIEALHLFHGSKKKVAHWNMLLKKSESLSNLPKELLGRLKKEIKSSESMVWEGHKIYKENASYKSIQGLRKKVAKSRIDLSEEIGVFKDRFQLQDDLCERINEVISCKKRLRLVDMEKLVDDVKSSGINFEDLRESLEKTMQVCRAFTVAIKEMKKSPTEIKRANQTYLKLPLISQNFDSMINKLEFEEEILENLDEMLEEANQETTDFEKISELENKLSSVKFYDLQKSRLQLFKRKVQLLKRESEKEDSEFTVAYVVVRSMRLESNEMVNKDEGGDKELAGVDKFLTDLDNDVKTFLENLAEVRNLKTFSKIKSTLFNFVDIGSELLDLQAKVKLNIQRAPSFIGLSEAKNALSGMKAQSGGSGRFLDLSHLQRGGAGPRGRGKLSKRFELKLKNLKKSINQKTEASRGQDPDQTRGQGLNIGILGKRVPPKKLDIRLVRRGLLEDLKFEMARNPYINESELEIANISGFIEKTIFSKTAETSYEMKMKKIIRLFSQIIDMKKLTILITFKNFDLNILLFLMEKPAGLLVEYEQNKERLLRDMGFGSLLEESPQRGQQRQPVRKSLQQKNLDRLENSLKEKMNDNRAGTGQPSAKISQQPGGSMNNEGKGKLTRSEIVVNNLRNTLYGNKAAGIEDPNPNFKIQKKTSQDQAQVQREYYKKQLLRPSEDFQTEEPLAQSVYRGQMGIETDQLSATVKYLDMITFEEPPKCSEFPALPQNVALKGTISEREFMNYVGKLIKKQQLNIKMLFGYLECDGQTISSLNSIFFLKKQVFYSKYLPECKIFLFPKKFLLNSWHESLNIDSDQLWKVISEIYWIKIVTNPSSEKSKEGIEFVKPEPLYSLNLKQNQENKEDLELTPVSSDAEGQEDIENTESRDDYQIKKARDKNVQSEEDAQSNLLDILRFQGNSALSSVLTNAQKIFHQAGQNLTPEEKLREQQEAIKQSAVYNQSLASTINPAQEVPKSGILGDLYRKEQHQLRERGVQGIGQQSRQSNFGVSSQSLVSSLSNALMDPEKLRGQYKEARISQKNAWQNQQHHLHKQRQQQQFSYQQQSQPNTLFTNKYKGQVINKTEGLSGSYQMQNNQFYSSKSFQSSLQKFQNSGPQIHQQAKSSVNQDFHQSAILNSQLNSGILGKRSRFDDGNLRTQNNGNRANLYKMNQQQVTARKTNPYFNPYGPQKTIRKNNPRLNQGGYRAQNLGQKQQNQQIQNSRKMVKTDINRFQGYPQQHPGSYSQSSGHMPSSMSQYNSRRTTGAQNGLGGQQRVSNMNLSGEQYPQQLPQMGQTGQNQRGNGNNSWLNQSSQRRYQPPLGKSIQGKFTSLFKQN